MRTLCVGVLAVCSACLGAEWKHGTVELHNGQKQEGAVLDQPGQPLKVKMGAVVATFQRHEVKAVAFEEAPEDNPFALMEKEYPDIAKDEGFRAVLRETVKDYPSLNSNEAWTLSMKLYSIKNENNTLKAEVDRLKQNAAKNAKSIAEMSENDRKIKENPRLDPERWIMLDPLLKEYYEKLTLSQKVRIRAMSRIAARGDSWTEGSIEKLAQSENAATRDEVAMIELFFPYMIIKGPPVRR